MTTFIDLSHAIRDGMPAYPGLPSPKIGCYLDHEQSRARYEDRAEFYLGSVEMSGNTGTYLDSPFHRYRRGADLSSLPLSAMAGLRGCVADAPAAAGPVDVTLPAGFDPQGAAVLVRTGWDARWGTPAYWEPGPWLSAAALDLLIATRVALVGVDFWNVDDTRDPSRPAHTRLLGAGILIVEHMANLGALPSIGFRFFAVPPRIVRGASFPVRAFAEVV